MFMCENSIPPYYHEIFWGEKIISSTNLFIVITQFAIVTQNETVHAWVLPHMF